MRSMTASLWLVDCRSGFDVAAGRYVPDPGLSRLRRRLRSADEVELEQGSELAQRLIRLLDLDRRHPELPRRLEVPPDVVEKRDARGCHAKLLAEQCVDARVGLAQAHNSRIDEDVEVRVETGVGDYIPGMP